MIDVHELKSGPVVKGAVDSQILPHGIKSDVYIWGKGKAPPTGHYTFLILQYICSNSRDTNLETSNSTMLFMPVYHESDYTQVIGLHTDIITSLKDWCIYRMGYIYHTNQEMISGNHQYVWNNIPIYRVRLNTDDKEPLRFIFGSCRRYCRLGPCKLFGTAGAASDYIFASINENIDDCDFYLACGDQVYFDPMGNLGRCTNKKAMRKLYDTIWGFPEFANLIASNKTYMICDDHDTHCNNNNWVTRAAEPAVFADGITTYREHQHYLGPIFGAELPLWYSFTIKDHPVFVFDTRSERLPGKIISEEQMQGFIDWIERTSLTRNVRFIVSPIPLLSQPETDNWYGFAKQQYQILSRIMEYDNIVILTGDAHCCRWGKYEIYLDGAFKGELIEILSSGLVAVNHDRGKAYVPGETHLNTYDVDNNFPHTICPYVSNNHSTRIITKEASPVFPEQTGGKLDKLKSVVTMTADCCYTKVGVIDDIVTVSIYNQHGGLLHTHELQL